MLKNTHVLTGPVLISRRRHRAGENSQSRWKTWDVYFEVDLDKRVSVINPLNKAANFYDIKVAKHYKNIRCEVVNYSGRKFSSTNDCGYNSVQVERETLIPGNVMIFSILPFRDYSSVYSANSIFI